MNTSGKEMNDLFIFGDSFAQPFDINVFPYTWTNKLTTDFVVKNYALSGTGPDWSLKLFTKITKTIKNYPCCIFCVSDISRVTLRFMEPKDAHSLKFFFQNTNPTVDDKLYKKYKQHLDFMYELNKFYLSHSSFYQFELLKIILYLKFYSDVFKKILVFPCFNAFPNEQIKKINTENFYVHNTLLTTYINIYDFGNPLLDTRPNHMTEHQHLEFYHIIRNLLLV